MARLARAECTLCRRHRGLARASADGVEKHTATALASIAMLQERIPVQAKSPA